MAKHKNVITPLTLSTTYTLFYASMINYTTNLLNKMLFRNDDTSFSMSKQHFVQ